MTLTRVSTRRLSSQRLIRSLVCHHFIILLFFILFLLHSLNAATTCFGRDSTDTFVCSGHGTCTATDTCTCSSGDYTGSDCSVTTCFGTSSTLSSVCNSRGSCRTKDICTCREGYTGNQCQTVLCNNIPAGDPNVCSNHGTCLTTRVCSCSTGYSGSYCDFYLCYGKSSKNSGVCGGHGTCTGVDTCTCQTGYGGNECNEFSCFGKPNSDPNICSTHGTCTSTDVCSCQPGWTSHECNLPQCNGVLANETTVCSGHGTCAGGNVCNCQTGYTGNDCQYPICNSIASNLPNVCSGHGTCLYPDVCSCQTGRYGKFCENYECYCESTNSPTVCSGHGTCGAPNNCTCSTGFSGLQCEFPFCFGIAGSDTQRVCSGHGTCLGQNQCSCQSGWTGSECQHAICYGRSAGYSSVTYPVCSGHGTCESPNVCKCTGNYRQADCSQPICYNLWHSSETCSKAGTCSAPNTCTCNSNAAGTQCERRSQYFLSTNPSTSAKIQNVDEYLTTQMTLNFPFKLFGTQYTRIRLSANGYMSFGPGTFSSPRTTFSTYDSDDAIIAAVLTDLDMRGTTAGLNTLYYRQSRNPPTSAERAELSQIQSLIRGRFASHPQYSQFTANWYWVTTYDGVGYYNRRVDRLNYVQVILTVDTTNGYSFVIFNFVKTGIEHPSTDAVVGILAPKTASTGKTPVNIPSIVDSTLKSSSKIVSNSNVGLPNFYIFPTHETNIPATWNLEAKCFGIAASNTSFVCSGHGTCSQENTCKCQPYFSGTKCETDCRSQTNYIGPTCSVPVCFGKSSLDSSVCSGHGTCDAPDTCSCTSGYSGSSCNVFSCFSVSRNDPSVCSGHGQCKSPDNCVCQSGWGHGSGTLNCHQFTCNGLDPSNPSACPNGGTCVASNTCSGCNAPFTGSTCLESVRYVNGLLGNDQGGANTCLDASLPCKTIEHAIGVSTRGSTIQISSGTYVLPRNTIFVTKSIRLIGVGGTVLLQSQSTHPTHLPHFTVRYHATPVDFRVESITVKDSVPDTFIKVACASGSKVTLSNVIVHGGGRVIDYIGSTRVVVSNSQFYNLTRSVPIAVRTSSLSTDDYVVISGSSFDLIRPADTFYPSTQPLYKGHLPTAALFAGNVSVVTINSTIFTRCSPSAVTIANATTVLVSGSQFGFNEAKNATSLNLESISMSSLIMTSRFYNNTATDSGVIIVRNTPRFNVTSTTFEYNVASKGGSSLVFDAVTSAHLLTTVCNANRAPYGACIDSQTSGTTIQDSTISNNVGEKGTAVYIYNSEMTVSSSVISGNLVSSGDVTFLSGLGFSTLILGASYLSVQSSTFENNHGAILSRDTSSMIITDSTFKYHTFGTVMIFSNRAVAYSSIARCVFTENRHSNGFGGSVTSFESYNTLYITQSTFSKSSSINGGAVAIVVQRNVQLVDNTFDSHTATQSGGALYFEQVNSTSIQSCSFTSNQAANGGSAYFKEVLQTRFFLRFGGADIQDTLFENNIATSDGGAVALSTENIFICTRCTFRSNTASKSGGALHADGVAYRSDSSSSFDYLLNEATFSELLLLNRVEGISLEKSVFDSNRANIGGAITTFSNGLTIKIDESTFNSNEANADGGSFYIFVNEAVIANSYFNSSKSLRGGCVFSLISVSSLVFTNSTFDRCNADVGAIYLSSDTPFYFNNSTMKHASVVSSGIFSTALVSVDSSLFEENYAKTFGSTLTLINTGTMIVSKTRFINNRADVRGGAIYTSSYGSMTFDGIVTKGNNAPLGATVFMDIPNDPTQVAPTSRTVNIDNSSIFEDVASIAGGSFFSNKKLLMDSVSGPVFNSNVSSTGYGPIFASEPVYLRAKYIETYTKPLTDVFERDGYFNFTSGNRFVAFPGQSFDAHFELVDGYGQIVSQYPGLSVKVTATDNRIIGASLEEIIIGSEAHFQKLQLFGKVDSTIKISFTAAGVDSIQPISFEVLFVECPKGYSFDDSDENIDNCNLCQKGSYTIRPFQKECSSSCVNFDCEASTITVQNGFWIDVSSDGGIRAVPCPNGKCKESDLEFFEDSNDDATPLPPTFSTFSEKTIGFLPLPRSTSAVKATLNANFSSLIPNSLKPVSSFRGAACEDERTGILCGQCKEGYSEWRGTCVPCTSSNPFLILGLLAYIFAIIFYVHYSSQNFKAGASVKILVSFSQTVFQTIDFPGWAVKRQNDALGFIFTFLISMFNLELPRFNTAADTMGCPFDRPGYWYYAAQMMQHIGSVFVIVIGLCIACILLALGTCSCCMCKCALCIPCLKQARKQQKKKNKKKLLGEVDRAEMGDLAHMPSNPNIDLLDELPNLRDRRKKEEEEETDEEEEEVDDSSTTEEEKTESPEQTQSENNTNHTDPDQLLAEKGKATDEKNDDSETKKKKRRLPPLTCLCTACCRLILRYIHPSAFMRSFINMLIFTYQPVVRITFTFLFGCYVTGTGEYIFYEKTNLACWSSQSYWIWSIFYLFVFIYVIAAPLLGVILLACNFPRLKNRRFIRYFGPIYEMYRPRYFWFEYINFVRRFCLIGGGVIATTLILREGTSGIQFVLYSVILSINYVLVHVCNPYKIPSDNTAEKFSLFITLFMLSIQEGTSDIAESVGIIFAMVVTTLSMIILVFYVIRENFIVKFFLRRLYGCYIRCCCCCARKKRKELRDAKRARKKAKQAKKQRKQQDSTEGDGEEDLMDKQPSLPELADEVPALRGEKVDETRHQAFDLVQDTSPEEQKEEAVYEDLQNLK